MAYGLSVLFADTNPPTLSALTSVSCSSQKFCMAVGDSDSTGPYGYSEKVPAAETWNGLQWQLISVPTNPASSDLETLDELTSVSCLSPSFCAVTVVTEGVTFVGSEPTSSLEGYAETWNGTSWSAQAIGNQPLAISCTSSSFCTAVGTEGGAAAGAFTLGGPAFATVFDGTSWTTTDFPLRRNNGVSRATLTTVSCLHSWCFATGTQQLFKQGPPGTYTSKGTTNIDATYQSMSWSSSSIPHPPVTPIGSSCTQPGNCVAVGQCSKAKCGVQESPLIEELTDGAWSFVPLTSGPVDGVLDADLLRIDHPMCRRRKSARVRRPNVGRHGPSSRINALAGRAQLDDRWPP